MEPGNSLRLSLFLNYCLFLYEICGEIEDSRLLAQKCFDEALFDLEKNNLDEIMEAVPIMQALRDNLNIWESEELTPK